MKQKVLIDTCQLLIARTGIRTYIEELVKGSAGQVDLNGHFWAPGYHFFSRTKFFQGRMNFWKKLLFHSFYLFWKQVALPLVALGSRSNVILIPDYLPPLIIFRSKLFIVFHDTFYWENPAAYNRIWRWYMTAFTNLAVQIHQPDIVATSSYVKGRVEKIFPWKLSTHVVYQSPRQLPEASDKPPPDYAYFLHVGTLEKRKNQRALIEAFQLFDRSHPSSMKLVLVGQGSPSPIIDEEELLKKMVESHGLRDRVIFTGYVSDQEIAYWYQHAAAFVFPSLEEGFGIPIIESMRQGIPTIISNKAALPEIAGDACLIWEGEGTKSLAQLMQQVTRSEKKADLKYRGLQRAKRFSNTRFVHEIDELISTP